MLDTDVLKPFPILYVEHNENIRISTKEILSIFFDDISVAKNGIEALKLVHEKKIHIAILDMHIPYINGVELAKEIRKYNREMVIFITSSYQESNNLKETLRLNMLNCLPKNFGFNELFEAIELCATRLLVSQNLKPHSLITL